MQLGVVASTRYLILEGEAGKRVDIQTTLQDLPYKTLISKNIVQHTQKPPPNKQKQPWVLEFGLLTINCVSLVWLISVYGNSFSLTRVITVVVPEYNADSERQCSP